MRAVKPGKPSKDFPRTAHPNGTWCKKIKGRLSHFGGWADPDAALAKYRHDVDDIQAGREPSSMADEGPMTLKELCLEFLDTKEKLTQLKKLSRRRLFDYARLCEWV